MWVYEDKSEDGIENVYVHHDIMLPAFPLTVAWLDCNPNGGEKGEILSFLVSSILGVKMLNPDHKSPYVQVTM